MRVAVIGLGSIGKRHVTNLKALGCDVVGFDAVEDAERRVGALMNIAVGASRIMSADAWVIATPLDRHLPWVEGAIDDRRPFCCEKPLGTLEQLPRWREIAAMNLPVNQVGYQLRFHADVVNGREIVGPFRWVEFRVECDMARWPGHSYGSAILECSHEIDLALWCGAGELLAARATDFMSLLIFRHGRVNINAQSANYWREWFGIGEHRWFQESYASPDELGNEMYVEEMRHFLDCVKEDKPTICPLGDGLKVLEVVAQVEQMTKANA